MQKNKFQRRDFLKIGTLGAVGAIAGVKSLAQDNLNKNNIVYRTLGKTGLRVPVVSLGVMRADTPAIVKRALEMGVVHLDTAHGYQDGRNEEMLGKLLQDYKRDSFIISTKIHLHRDKVTKQFSVDATKEKFLEMFDISLKRLNLPYVDILYLHVCETRGQVLHPEMMEAMRIAKEMGKTRFTGVSTHSNEPEVISAAIESNFYDIVLSSYNFRQKHHAEVASALERAHNAGLGTIVMKTMAGAYYDKERQHPINCTAALKWSVRHEFVHTSIPGASTFEELEKNCNVMYNPVLTTDEANELFAGEQQAGLFCSGCSECSGRCPEGLPIQDIMRGYMYAYGYKDLYMAQKTISLAGLSENPCANCDDCKIECINGWDVKQKVRDIARIQSVPQEFLDTFRG